MGEDRLLAEPLRTCRRLRTLAFTMSGVSLRIEQRYDMV